MIINFNNIGSVTGGGGTPSPSPSNYRVVDALSAITNPTEGLMAFVKSKTKVTNGVRIEISDWDAFPKEADGRANGYLAIIQDEYWDESTQAPNSNSVFPVILIGNQFNLFKNDDNFHSANASHNGDTYNYVYKTHNGEESGYGSYIDLYMIDKPFKLWLNNGCSTAVTTTPYVEITPGQTYLYSAGQWVEIVSTTVKMEDIPLSTRADVAEFVSKVRASVARGIYPSILLGDDICTYNGDSGDFVKFAGDAGRDKVILYFSDKIYNSDGFEDRGLKGDYERRYTLPVASANELGGVKIGQGISIDQNGVISAQGGKNDIVLDIAELDNMSYADRKVLWDEVYEKILAGHKIYAKGEIGGGELGYYAYLPLEKYTAETDTSYHIGGFLCFAVKDINANSYLNFVFTSAGNLSGISHSKLSKEDIYSLPIAKSNTLGGVKIGSGISIDEDGVISAQGGGSGGYNVVDSLPETGSATESALYYVKPYVESLEYRGISISTTSSEGDVAYIHNGKGKQYRVYISGTNFHWGWNNDGEYHKFNNADFWYKTDNASKTFNAYFPDDTWTVTLGEGATSAETSPYTVQISHDGTTYRFNGTGYTIDGGNDNIFYFGNDNFSRLMNLKENGVDLSQLTYVYNERQYALFDHYESDTNKFIFRLTDSTTEPIGTPLMEYNIRIEVTEGGDNQSYRSSQLPMTVELDMSSSGLSTGYWVRTIYGGQYGGNPIILRSTNEIWTQNVWFRPFYNADNSTWESLSNERKIFGAEFYYRGKKIVAEWIVGGEGNSNLMNWTETELSTANSTPPQA